MDTKKVGENLRRIRKQKNLKICELAVMADMSKEWIGVLESGTKKPRPETLGKLVSVLGCAMEDLVD